MTELERALLHIKTRADAWAVKEIEKALSQEPTSEMVHVETLHQVMWERDIAIGQLKELGYGFGQKVEPCDDVVSRRKAISVISACDGKSAQIEALEKLPPVNPQPCDDAISRDFQIGDEVRIIGSDSIYDDCDVGWVIRNASEKIKTMYVMRNDGSAGEEAKVEWYKTGRHNVILAEAIKALPSVTQKPGKYTADELKVFADGISLSLCSKKSAQHWSYDEKTAEQIRWLECLHSKVMTDIADMNCGAKMESEET